MEDRIIKYPRTPHIEGSRLQPGDEDMSQRGFLEIAGRHVVVEEKIDGANTALSFTPQGELRLQSRGQGTQPQTVGVPLQHRHDPAPGGQRPADGGHIVPQSG